MENRLNLYAMTQKGFEVLKTLSEGARCNINAVISARDQKVKNDHYEDIKVLCESVGIPFYDRAESGGVSADFVLAVSWRWLIDSPSAQTIVFHDSLLPRYRGFNPLVSCLINGEPRIGVTALLASDEYDKGNIIAQSSTEVSYPIKIQDAIELSIGNYRELALTVAKMTESGKTITGRPQDERLASYSLWRDEEDYRIDWSQSADDIKRFVDAVGYPYHGASAMMSGNLVRLLDADVIADVKVENRTPGKVIFLENSRPVVTCGSGLLKINELVDEATGDSLLPLSRFRTRFS